MLSCAPMRICGTSSIDYLVPSLFNSAIPSTMKRCCRVRSLDAVDATGFFASNKQISRTKKYIWKQQMQKLLIDCQASKGGLSDKKARKHESVREQ